MYYLRILVFAVVLCTINACVSLPQEVNSGAESPAVVNYTRNRLMDARDAGAATVMYGMFAGLKLQIGPLGIGGMFLPAGGGHGSMAEELGWRHGELGTVSSREFFLGYGFDQSGTGEGRSYPRGKHYSRTYAEEVAATGPAVLERPHNYTRLGLAVGLLGGLRLEVNPGEWLDLLLGLLTVDIYDDDVYRRSSSGAPSLPAQTPGSATRAEIAPESRGSAAL